MNRNPRATYFWKICRPCDVQQNETWKLNYISTKDRLRMFQFLATTPTCVKDANFILWFDVRELKLEPSRDVRRLESERPDLLTEIKNHLEDYYA